MKKVKRSHFIGFRIQSDSIWKKIDSLQAEIIKENPQLEKLKVTSSEMHITLFTMKFYNEDEIRKAKKILETCLKKYGSKLEKVIFKGIDTFDSRLMYMKLQDEKPIFEFREL